jgi:hypothetical protein
MYVLVEEDQKDQVTGVDEMSSMGVEVILLLVDRHTNMLKEIDREKKRLQKVINEKQTEFGKNISGFKEYVKTTFSTQYAQPVFDKFSIKLEGTLHEMLVVGELSKKHNINKTPAIIFKADAGFKYLYDQTNLTRAYDALQRRDYVTGR